MSIKLFILLMLISVCVGIINPLVLHTIGMLASEIKSRPKQQRIKNKFCQKIQGFAGNR